MRFARFAVCAVGAIAPTALAASCVDYLDADAGASNGRSPDGSAPVKDSAAPVEEDGAPTAACTGTCSDGGCFEGVCGGAAVQQVAAGVDSACAVLRSGSVRCWGSNVYGQIGVGSVGNQPCPSGRCRPTPTAVSGLVDVRSVSVGHAFACAIKNDGTVWCWGANASGALGHDNATDPLCSGVPCQPVPTQVSGLAGVDQIATGYSAVCAATTSGAVWCWGSDVNGDVPGGTLGKSVVSPVKSPAPSGVVQLSASNWAGGVCAVDSSGSAWCWGYNSFNALGHAQGADGDLPSSSCSGPAPCNPVPHRVADDATGSGFPVGDATQVLAQDSAGCALRRGGATWCWGYAGNGLVPAPGGAVPVKLAGLPPLSTMEGRDQHACGVAGDNTVWCWGIGALGQLGNGIVSSDAGASQCGEYCGPPTQVPGLRVSAIAADGMTVALATDGTVWSWGPNDYGQLGHNPGTSGDVSCTNRKVSGAPHVSCNPKPTMVPGLPPASQ